MSTDRSRRRHRAPVDIRRMTQATQQIGDDLLMEHRTWGASCRGESECI